MTALCPGPGRTEFTEVARRSTENDTELGPEFVYVSVEEVVAAGLRGVTHDRALVIPRWAMTAGMALGRLTPRAVLPFATTGLVGFGSSLLPPYDRNRYDPWLALLVLAVATFSESITLRRSTRTWVDPVAPWLFFVSVAILRDASGGATSRLAPLVALPEAVSQARSAGLAETPPRLGRN